VRTNAAELRHLGEGEQRVVVAEEGLPLLAAVRATSAPRG
jgi:hypothetical protein